jgi:hypothetical protein
MIKTFVSSVVFCVGLPFVLVGVLFCIIAYGLFTLAIMISDPEEEI